jgi:uncharacterized protein (DUF433 family)
MTVELADRIVANPKVLGGKPTVKGTRISVEMVIGMLASEWPEDEILRNFPTLKHEDIVACLNYARNLVERESILTTAA